VPLSSSGPQRPQLQTLSNNRSNSLLDTGLGGVFMTAVLVSDFMDVNCLERIYALATARLYGRQADAREGQMSSTLSEKSCAGKPGAASRADRRLFIQDSAVTWTPRDDRPDVSHHALFHH